MHYVQAGYWVAQIANYRTTTGRHLLIDLPRRSVSPRSQVVQGLSRAAPLDSLLPLAHRLHLCRPGLRLWQLCLELSCSCQQVQAQVDPAGFFLPRLVRIARLILSTLFSVQGSC